MKKKSAREFSFLPRSLKNSVFRGVRRRQKRSFLTFVFLTPRQKVSFGPRTQNDDFLGTRPRAAPLGSCQKNSSFFVLGTKLLFSSSRAPIRIGLRKSKGSEVVVGFFLWNSPKKRAGTKCWHGQKKIQNHKQTNTHLCNSVSST